jgi:flagellar hook-associated protein 2
VTSRLATGEEGFRDISQLGVSTIDKFGQLKFDTDKFAKALAEDPDKVMKFFFHKDEEGNEVGFVARLNSYIDSFISKDNGILKSKNESFEKAIKDLNRRIEDFQARMEKKEEQLIKKFTALDVAMMQGESQMLWLQGQVDAMNASMNAMRNRR